jgi:hypothetical protein
MIKFWKLGVLIATEMGYFQTLVLDRVRRSYGQMEGWKKGRKEWWVDIWVSE